MQMWKYFWCLSSLNAKSEYIGKDRTVRYLIFVLRELTELAAIHLWNIVISRDMPPQIPNWDKLFLTLVAFFSSQMMRHKSLVPRSGLSPLIQPQMIMLLLHIGCFDKCLITLVALGWDVETQIVGCQLARGETPRWSHKTQLIAQISGPHSQSHSRLQQIQQIHPTNPKSQSSRGRNTFTLQPIPLSVSTNPKSLREKYFCPREIIRFQQIENPGGEMLFL